MSKRYPYIATYIMASRPFGVLYTGHTSICRSEPGNIEKA